MQQFLLKNFDAVRTAIAILIGMLICVLLIILVSSSPGDSISIFLFGPFSSQRTIASIFEIATPIIFTGVALSIAFQAEQFYIGAEGAFYITAAVGTAFAVSTSMPWFFHIPLILLVSGTFGGLWGLIPGYLKARFNTSEVVTALMLNFVALYAGLYLINNFFRDRAAGFMVSFRLPESAELSRFIDRTRIHWGVVLALVVAVWAYYFLYHTRTGYEIRTVGHNPKFARFGGINVFKVIIIVHILTGAIAGMGGMVEIMGIHRRFNWQDLPGQGWDGVIVAIIGRMHPLYVVAAAIFLGYLRVGGQQLRLMSDVPFELVLVIQSAIILLITARAFLSQWEARMVIRQASEEAES
ncbi:MAG: ABC transporter permease [Spirochaetaceae bacterium]|nr:MAG: ABC transporter permease [Spirochaetaceae bacterium]